MQFEHCRGGVSYIRDVHLELGVFIRSLTGNPFNLFSILKSPIIHSVCTEIS